MTASLFSSALPTMPTSPLPVTTSPLPQWKMIYLARRNPGLAAQDLPQAWREHSALGRQCRNVQDKVLGVMQCSRVRDEGSENDGLSGASTAYDGVNLLRLRDLSVATDIWDDPETQAIMRPDEPRVFSTYVREFSLVCAEHVQRDAPPTGVVVFGFLHRLPSVSPTAFRSAWTIETATAWLDAPALYSTQRVVHNLVVQPPPVGYDFDGIAEWWFADGDAARAAFASGNIVQQLPKAYSAIADLAQSVFMFTQVTHQRP